MRLAGLKARMVCPIKSHRGRLRELAARRRVSLDNRLSTTENGHFIGKYGAPGPIRTGDPLLRRQTLYPTELRARPSLLFDSTALAILIRVPTPFEVSQPYPSDRSLSAGGKPAQFHCQTGALRVSFFSATLRPEERHELHLLYVLYACVLWRGEAEHLANSSSPNVLQPTARKNWQVGFLFSVQPSFRAKAKSKEKEQCPNINTPKSWFPRNGPHKT
jgi:hypothetical protein